MKYDDLYVRAAGYRFRIRVHGEGRPLICLHTFAENAESWDQLQLPGYTIFAIDLIGHGKSDKPTEQEPYKLDNVLQQLRELIFQISETTSYELLGYSLGGRLALQCALTMDKQPSHLILESTETGIKDEAERLHRYLEDLNLSDRIRARSVDDFVKFWTALPIFQSQRKLPALTRLSLREQRLGNETHALANMLHGCGLGITPYLGEQTTKAIYLYGEPDVAHDQLFPGLRIPNAGLDTHLEQPQLFNQTLIKLLKNK